MQVAVIGAGATGLCAAKHLTQAQGDFSCVVYEQTSNVGGTWVYDECTGYDKYGVPIGSAMYKNLRTNLPTITMEFADFPFVSSNSFVTAREVLKYLEDYCDNFNLKNHIKFRHQVKAVIPKEEKWSIVVKDILNNVETTEEFDAVLICNGHFSVPYMGDFPDTSHFEGEVRHSHTYRVPEPYQGKTVLISGGGPSGVDISYDLAPFTTKVYFSPRNKINMDADFPKNVYQSPLVKKVMKDHVVFEDGSVSDKIHAIIICTGYKYSVPFITPECGISVVEDKFLQPLHKQIFNINHPTMAFIGLVFHTFLFPIFDLQVQFVLKHLSGEQELPSKEEMMAEFSSKLQRQRENGVPVRKYHEIGLEVKKYIDDLTKTANLKELLPVVYNIYYQTGYLRKYHLTKYRDANFKVIDQEDFEMTGLKIEEV